MSKIEGRIRLNPSSVRVTLLLLKASRGNESKVNKKKDPSTLSYSVSLFNKYLSSSTMEFKAVTFKKKQVKSQFMGRGWVSLISYFSLD